MAETGFAPVSEAYEAPERAAAPLRNTRTRNDWSRSPASNRQPAVYKTAARPLVLERQWRPAGVSIPVLLFDRQL